MTILDSLLRPIGLGRLSVATDVASRFAGDTLDAISLDDWLGALPEWIPVNRHNAMQIGTVASMRHTVASSSRLPFALDQRGRRVDLGMLPILRQVERGVPLSTTLQWTYDALFHHPATWWRIVERDASGWPRWGEWVDRSRVTLDDGVVVKIDGREIVDRLDGPVGWRRIDLVQFDSPLGEGFLHLARKTIRRAIALELSASLVEDNPVPTVELHNEAGKEMSEQEISDLLDAWQSARRKRGVAYTPKGLKVIAHGQAPQQLLIDGRRRIDIELVRHANMPAWAASTAVEGATLTYENRSSRNWELIDLGLAGFHAAIADRLSMPDFTPNGWSVRVDVDGLTRPDERTRFETYEIGKRAGFIDNAWIAEREGWSTVPAEPERNPNP